MKNKPVGKVTVPAKAKGDGISSLFAEVRNLIQSARRSAASFVDTPSGDDQLRNWPPHRGA